VIKVKTGVLQHYILLLNVNRRQLSERTGLLWN